MYFISSGDMKSKPQRLPTSDEDLTDGFGKPSNSDEAFDALSSMSIDAPSRRASEMEIELSDVAAASPRPVVDDEEIEIPIRNPLASKLAIQTDDEFEMPSDFSNMGSGNSSMYSPSTDINGMFFSLGPSLKKRILFSYVQITCLVSSGV